MGGTSSIPVMESNAVMIITAVFLPRRGRGKSQKWCYCLLNPHLPGGSLPFPEQLNDFNISNVEPDERPGFFQHHTIELSWERPDSMY